MDHQNNYGLETTLWSEEGENTSGLYLFDLRRKSHPDPKFDD